MADSRLYLEHIDTGKRVLIAKRFGASWIAWHGVEDKLDALFDAMEPHERYADTTDDGQQYWDRVWRLCYEDSPGAGPHVPPNRREDG